MKALVIDDSAVMRKVLQRALADPLVNVLEVMQATNGQEALTYLRGLKETGETLDLILCDINMPVMDGLLFLECAQSEGLIGDVPVVVVTTEAGERLVLRAIGVGASAYICKPFSAEQVRSRILPLLARNVAQVA
jgi:two-component system chemotaxis response regulator CheY